MANAKNTVASARSGRSIVYYLSAIALMTLLPSFIFAGVLLQRNHAAQAATLETLIVATSRSLVQSVEREINANVTTLRVLVTNPALRSGDYRTFHDQTVLALEGTGKNFFVIEPDLMTSLSTRLPYGSPPVRTADPIGAERAFQSDQLVITDLVLGAISKEWVYNILMPIDLGPAGEKIVALNQTASNFDNTLLANKLPEGWQTALIDTQGHIIAATGDVGAVGTPLTAFDVMAQPFSTGWQSINTEAGPIRVVMQRSYVTGWRMVAWAPEGVIARPLFEAVMQLAAGGLILGALILIGLYWVSRRIGSSVRGLARDARRLGVGDIVVAKPYPVTEIAEVSLALEQASQQRQASEQEVNFLMREVAHRSKNQMTVIAAMAKQTARGADDVASYVQGFERRIHGLARSTDLLLTHGRAGVDFGELFSSQLAAFSPQDEARVMLEGPRVRLNIQSAQIMGMAAHELATNAVKYGAFASDTGTLRVAWQLVEDRLDLIWRETVPERFDDSGRTGFGTTVLKSMVARSLNAEVERLCHADGIEWRFAIPLASIDPAQGDAEDEEAAAE